MILDCKNGKIDLILTKSLSRFDRGFKTWSCETINKILSNEKYTGNVLFQKTVVKDFFSEKQVLNTNEAKYLITGCNPVIISEYKFKHYKQRRCLEKVISQKIIDNSLEK